jgi:hypothetical protein
LDGSVGLAVNGTLFDQVDELLIVTAAIMAGLFTYMIVYEIRRRGRPCRADWWPWRRSTPVSRRRSDGSAG